MKKRLLNKTKVQSEKAPPPPLKISYIIILLAYALITVMTPHFNAWDSNGPKFLSLSLLNLFTFIFLLSRKEFRSEPNVFWSFFLNKIGLAYTLFMVVILVSFTKAINIPEAILSFLKYFTVFCSAYILSILLRSDKRHFRMLVIVMALVLISDSITVFYNIFLYISKQLGSILDIQSVYSNKNILAAAIFVKIPFALWLATFEKGWLKKLGFITLFCAELAVFFMSTRAFYLGLIAIALVYGAYLLILNIRNGTIPWYKSLIPFFGTLALALLFYSFTQHYLFPKKIDTYNKSYIERISTIASGESGRLDNWKRSAILFKQNPLLGVGTGNWKIQILKYENQTSSDFVFMFKNHNDFIEIATETGVFGGLLFFSLFVFLILNFLKLFFNPGASDISYLFLPAFGVLCYSVDAFFNFPADRPEMQSLFALFVGAGIAFSASSFREVKITNHWHYKSLSVFIILLLLISSYILILNFNTLKLQYIATVDLKEDKLTHASKVLKEDLSSFLNVSAVGSEPLSIYKSRYLINEGRYQEAIDVLRPDISNPYLGRRELFMAVAFSKMGNNDSAYAYANKVHQLKPGQSTSVGIICNVLNVTNRRTEAIKMMEDFLALHKTNSQAWLDLTFLYRESCNYQKAAQTIDTAIKLFPGDSTILKTKIKLQRESRIVPNQQIYSAAMDCLSKKKFPEALKYLDEFISKETGVAIVFAGRAYCYYNSKEYKKCISDVGRSISLGNATPDLVNLRGLCFQKTGDMNSACTDFHKAALMGDKDARNNEQRFCKAK